MLLLLSADIFKNLLLQKIFVGYYQSVGPDLGPNFLQWLSA